MKEIPTIIEVNDGDLTFTMPIDLVVMKLLRLEERGNGKLEETVA